MGNNIHGFYALGNIVLFTIDNYSVLCSHLRNAACGRLYSMTSKGLSHFRSHLEDVYDICWSKDSKCLVSGSVDNSAILWDVKKGQRMAIFPEHKSFVQGVAFDPLHQYVATMSSDR